MKPPAELVQTHFAPPDGGFNPLGESNLHATHFTVVTGPPPDGGPPPPPIPAASRPAAKAERAPVPNPQVVDAPPVLPTVPGYAVRRELGRGGMGVVYEAVAVELGRTVALKFLPDVSLNRPEHRGQFQDEARAVARLAHPNVVQVYEFGESDGRPYLALEYVPGGTLGERLRSAGPLPVADAVRVVRDLALAVQHAHENRMLHRDIKPGNVLLGPGGTPKLSDFGLAKLLDADSGRTRTGAVVGTPSYMAPEMAAGRHRTASPATDVYGLGAVLYECLTGRPPLVGETVWDTLILVVEADPEPPRKLRREIPAGLEAVCLKALAKNPADRYPTAGALAADLDRVAAGKRVTAARPRPAANGEGRSFGGRVLVGGLVALAVVLGAAGFDGWARYRDGEEASRVGRELLRRGAYAEADEAFARGLRRVGRLPFAAAVTEELAAGQRLTGRGRGADELHRFVDRLRFGYDGDALPPAERQAVGDACDALWAARAEFAAKGGLGPEAEKQIAADLLDLALLSADLRARTGGPPAALKRLAEAEQTLGPDPVLVRVGAGYRPGAAPPPPDPDAPAWESFAAGRSRLNAGDLGAASRLLAAALDREPNGFWPNFYAGVCAYRRDEHAQALSHFSACLAVAHDRRAACLYNRGLAYHALGDRDAALADCEQALKLEPTLAAAAALRDRLRAK